MEAHHVGVTAMEMDKKSPNTKMVTTMMVIRMPNEEKEENNFAILVRSNHMQTTESLHLTQEIFLRLGFS